MTNPMLQLVPSTAFWYLNGQFTVVPVDDDGDLDGMYTFPASGLEISLPDSSQLRIYVSGMKDAVEFSVESQEMAERIYGYIVEKQIKPKNDNPKDMGVFFIGVKRVPHRFAYMLIEAEEMTLPHMRAPENKVKLDALDTALYCGSQRFKLQGFEKPKFFVHKQEDGGMFILSENDKDHKHWMMAVYADTNTSTVKEVEHLHELCAYINAYVATMWPKELDQDDDERKRRAEGEALLATYKKGVKKPAEAASSSSTEEESKASTSKSDSPEDVRQMLLDAAMEDFHAYEKSSEETASELRAMLADLDSDEEGEDVDAAAPNTSEASSSLVLSRGDADLRSSFIGASFDDPVTKVPEIPDYGDANEYITKLRHQAVKAGFDVLAKGGALTGKAHELAQAMSMCHFSGGKVEKHYKDLADEHARNITSSSE